MLYCLWDLAPAISLAKDVPLHPLYLTGSYFNQLSPKPYAQSLPPPETQASSSAEPKTPHTFLSVLCIVSTDQKLSVPDTEKIENKSRGPLL